MANVKRYNTTVVPDNGQASTRLELDMFGVCSCESTLTDGRTVYYPEGFPAQWLVDDLVTKRTAVTAKQKGWSFLQFARSIFSDPSPLYLLPPRQLAAQLLRPAAYGVLVDMGIFEFAGAPFIMEGLGNVAAFQGLKQLFDGNYVHLRNDGLYARPEDAYRDVRSALRAGYMIVSVDGDPYLVPPEGSRSVLYGHEYEEQRLSDRQLLLFRDLGLISIRSDVVSSASVAGHFGAAFENKASAAIQRFARPREPLDLEAFISERFNRWGGRVVTAVVQPDALQEGVFREYPEISDLLMGYRFFLEPREVKAISGLLMRLREAPTLESQGGCSHALVGALGKIAFRAELFQRYQRVLSQVPNALLLLQGDFVSPDGVKSTSAMIGEVVHKADGPVMKIYSLYSTTVDNRIKGAAEFRLQRQKNVKLRDSIHLKMAGTRGATIPVEQAEGIDHGSDVVVLDAGLADEIRSTVNVTLKTALLKLPNSTLNVPRNKELFFRDRPAERIPIGGNLHSMTNERLDSLAVNGGGELMLHGIWANGRTLGLSLITQEIFESGEGMCKGYFTIKLQKGDTGWNVVYAGGTNVKPALNELKMVPGGPDVPSFERLSVMSGSSMSLTDLDSVARFSTFDPAQIDLWSKEFRGGPVVLSGVIDRELGVTEFRINEPGNYQHFMVELQRMEDGRWKVVKAGGVNVAMILDQLRGPGDRFEVPSNEWLSRESGLYKSLTTFDTPAAFAGLTPAILDRWALDFASTDSLELSGELNTGKIFGFDINDANISDRSFRIRFEKKDGAWRVAGAGGYGAEPVLSAIRAAVPSGIVMPSNEWLTKDWRYVMTGYTSVDSLKSIDAKQLDRWRVDYSSSDLVVSGLHKTDGNVQGFAINAPERHGAFFVHYQWKDGGWRVLELRGNSGVGQVLEAIRSVPGNGVYVPSDEFVLTGKGGGSRFQTLASLKQIDPATLDRWAFDFGSETIELSGMVDSREAGNIGAFGINRSRKVVNFYVTLVKLGGTWIVADAGNKNSFDVVDVLRGVDGIYVPSNEWLTANRDGKNYSQIDSIEALAGLTLDMMERWWLEFKTAYIELSGARDYAAGGDPNAITNFRINAEREAKRFFLTFSRGAEGEWYMAGKGGPVVEKVSSAVMDSPFAASMPGGKGTQNLELLSVMDLLGGGGGSSGPAETGLYTEDLRLRSSGKNAELNTKAALDLDKALEIARKVERTRANVERKIDRK